MPERRVIALVTDAIGPYHRGGKEQRYVELSRRLATTAEVHVYTMNWWGGPRVRIDEGVTYHAICPLLPLYSGPRRSIRQAVVFALCCLALLWQRFDVIEADHMPYMQLITLKLVALVRRRRLVITWHECWGPDYWRSYLGRAGVIGWLCESIAMRLPDTIIAASPQTGDRLRAFTHGRVPVTVAPNGIDLAQINRIAAATDPADLVTVGRLLPHKRIDMLLDALVILRDQGRPLTARIVGTGPHLAMLIAQVRACGLSDSVDFQQHLETADLVYAALKAARVAVFPSEREGFGIAVLEALACGVPVIATSAPDNLARHLVARSNDGVVCEPTPEALAEAIQSVLDRPDTPSQADLTWLSEFDWERITASVAEVLS